MTDQPLEPLDHGDDQDVEKRFPDGDVPDDAELNPDRPDYGVQAGEPPRD